MVPLGRINHIIVHCSDTDDGPSLSWPVIRRVHVEERGWDDVGYHAGIEFFGPQIVLCPGRPLWAQGAHCKAAGRNRDSLGVCLVGDFDERPPADELWDCAAMVVAHLALLTHVRVEDVRGHREFDAAKTCPGSRFDLERFRRDVGLRMRSGFALLGWGSCGREEFEGRRG